MRIPTRPFLLTAIALACLGNSDCSQSLDPSPPDGEADGPQDATELDAPADLAPLAAECAPVAWLTCGDRYVADTSDDTATDAIDFWPVSIGNYDGPEIAFAFRPDSTGEASVKLIDAEPGAMNQDLFVLRGSDRCVGEAAFGRGFNSLEFEATGGELHFVVVDGFDGDAGAFELELECDLGGEDGEVPPAEDPECRLDLDVPGTVQSVLDASGLPGLDATFPPAATAVQQGWDNEVCFEEALDAAIASWLRDDRDYESPLALVLDIDEGPCLQEDPSERVRCFMNRPGSRVDLIVPGGPHPPEHGEGLSAAWAFFLDLPELSDHLYWAIVPRDGERDPYNYGFN